MNSQALRLLLVGQLRREQRQSPVVRARHWRTLPEEAWRRRWHISPYLVVELEIRAIFRSFVSRKSDLNTRGHVRYSCQLVAVVSLVYYEHVVVRVGGPEHLRPP